ncbi:hypothetical protein TVAG_480980 [Trichomonas vaginalis G3]|uniref:Uncharacterized protein n=1 Tax=Trichomonas vaginalis (strain ATCC PRA-98 / G3) TaxID=412133 RepID=A2F8P4_TRIV3|nr:hypothetical protein TVAGG3_0456390 [Trichomonas vaginalis G3]EAX98722.1 hypothetical protein TVAG_480980 [Trichomonas vaginalis G3]KAI5538496.1 hypothetical protein TVAGG3_0456390 [Trichomonas vaginalis G3]|eukprot:XP_001311652.1 hypothetical protein [Trichomonas vaginalis G3]
MKDTLKSLYRGMRGCHDPSQQSIEEYVSSFHQWLYSILKSSDKFSNELKAKSFILNNLTLSTDICKRFPTKSQGILVNMIEILRILLQPVEYNNIRNVSWQSIIQIVNIFSEYVPFQAFAYLFLTAFYCDPDTVDKFSLGPNVDSILLQTKEISKKISNSEVRLSFYWAELYVTYVFPQILNSRIEADCGKSCIFLIITSIITKLGNGVNIFINIPISGVSGKTEIVDDNFCILLLKGINFINDSDSLIFPTHKLLNSLISYHGIPISTSDDLQSPQFSLVSTFFAPSHETAVILDRISNNDALNYQVTRLIIKMFSMINSFPDPVAKKQMIEQHIIRSRIFLAQSAGMGRSAKFIIELSQSLVQLKKPLFAKLLVLILNVISDVCITDIGSLFTIYSCMEMASEYLQGDNELKSVLAHISAQLALISMKCICGVDSHASNCDVYDNHVLRELTLFINPEKENLDSSLEFPPNYFFQPNLNAKDENARLFVYNFLEVFGVTRHHFIIAIFATTWLQAFKFQTPTDLRFFSTDLVSLLLQVLPSLSVRALQIISEIAHASQNEKFQKKSAVKYLVYLMEMMGSKEKDIRAMAAQCAMTYFLCGQTLSYSLLPKIVDYLDSLPSFRVTPIVCNFIISCISIAIASNNKEMENKIIKISGKCYVTEDMITNMNIVLSASKEGSTEFRKRTNSFIAEWKPSNFMSCSLLLSCPFFFDEINSYNSFFFDIIISSLVCFVSDQQNSDLNSDAVAEFIMTIMSNIKNISQLTDKIQDLYSFCQEMNMNLDRITDSYDQMIYLFMKRRSRSFVNQNDVIAAYTSDKTEVVTDSSNCVTGKNPEMSFKYKIEGRANMLCQMMLQQTFGQTEEICNSINSVTKKVITVMIETPKSKRQKQFVEMLGQRFDTKIIRKTPLLDIVFDLNLAESEFAVTFSLTKNTTRNFLEISILPCEGNFINLMVKGEKSFNSFSERYIVSLRDAVCITLSSILMTYQKLNFSKNVN